MVAPIRRWALIESSRTYIRPRVLETVWKRHGGSSWGTWMVTAWLPPCRSAVSRPAVAAYRAARRRTRTTPPTTTSPAAASARVPGSGMVVGVAMKPRAPFSVA